MDTIALQRKIWDECQEYIKAGKDISESPLYTKLGEVFKAYQSENHWKDSFTAVITSDETAEWLQVAIIWYHGCKPLTRHTDNVWYIASFGYSC